MKAFRRALSEAGMLEGCIFNHRLDRRHLFRWSFAWPRVKVALEYHPAADFGRLSPDWHARKVRVAQRAGWITQSVSERDPIAPAVARLAEAIRERESTNEVCNENA